MASVFWYQLIFLSKIWCVSHGVPVDVTLVPRVIMGTCGENVLLPCRAHRDPEVTYNAVSWSKMDKNHNEIKELQHKKEQEYSGGLNQSFSISNNTWDSLEITNVTCYSTGTYKCVLWAPVGNNNQSSTITLKVIGCPEEEEEEDRISKHRTELVLLFSLALFYLLLICFTCTCLKEKSPSNYHKRTKNHTVRRPYLISTH